MKNKIIMMIITATLCATALCACNKASEAAGAPEVSADTEIKSEETEGSEKQEEPEAAEPADQEASAKEAPVQEEETGSVETTEEPDTIEKILDSYMADPNKQDLKYVMYDVNADGIEELIFTREGRIAEIYGTRAGKPQLTVSCNDNCEMTLYPKGMLEVKEKEPPEQSGTRWYQYFPDWGDFLPVFEESLGEYYTFCAYNLSEESINEINGSLDNVGDYPVWIGEWSDMISQKEYDSLVPKSDPVKLIEADSLSDRDALETLPEYFEYVKAPDGYANLRTGPGTEYDVICRVPTGNDLEVYKKSATSNSGKTWRKVAYFIETDNEPGYAWLAGWISESQLE